MTREAGERPERLNNVAVMIWQKSIPPIQHVEHTPFIAL